MRSRPRVCGPQVVIAEDRHQLVAARLHARRVPRPLRDHDLAARREGRRAVVVLDHPGLRRISEDSAAPARPPCHPPWRARPRSCRTRSSRAAAPPAPPGPDAEAPGPAPGASRRWAPGAGGAWGGGAGAPVDAGGAAAQALSAPTTAPNTSNRLSRTPAPDAIHLSLLSPRRLGPPALIALHPSVNPTQCSEPAVGRLDDVLRPLAGLTHPASGRELRRRRPALPCPSPGSRRASAR